MLTIERIIEDIHAAILEAADLDENMPIVHVVSEMPSEHRIHGLLATGFQCLACGSAGFVKDVMINVGTGIASCPECFSNGSLCLLEGGAA